MEEALIEEEEVRGSGDSERGGTEVSSRQPAGTQADFFEDGEEDVEVERCESR